MVELTHDSRPIIGRGPALGATFITLAIASIALMVADHRYDQLGRIRGWMAAATHPVQEGVDAPFRLWNWLTGSVADRSQLRRENLELTARLRLANLQLQRFALLEDENRRLRDMRANTSGVTERVLVASILNVDLDPFRHRVLLDKGAQDGVFKGQAVLDGEGIFGQVTRVNPATSEVILISDAEHAIPVQSNRSGLRTIAVGSGDSSKLSLPFVTGESDLKAGDLLLSTGMGGVFPPGYPVAKVTTVKRDASATFAVVEARPTAKLDRAREVLLAWFKPPVVATEATAAEAGASPATAAATPSGQTTTGGANPAIAPGPANKLTKPAPAGAAVSQREAATPASQQRPATAGAASTKPREVPRQTPTEGAGRSQSAPAAAAPSSPPVPAATPSAPISAPPAETTAPSEQSQAAPPGPSGTRR